MNIHEYQASQLLCPIRRYFSQGGGLRDSAGSHGRSPNGSCGGGSTAVVLKSQIHAGGRGKGTFKSGLQGGVKLCRTADEAESTAAAMLGQTLVTKQTGPEGRVVRKLFVVEAIQVRKEFYLAVVLDRASGRPVIMASTEGGMDIEESRGASPEKIFRETIDPALGLMPYQGRKLAVALGLRGELIQAAGRLIGGVWKTWWECDATLVEINPLAIIAGPDGKDRIVAIDAKIGEDDNALPRHPEIQAMRDFNEESPLEVEASHSRAELHQAGGKHRLPGERRRSGDGDDGHYQALRRVAGRFLDVGGGACGTGDSGVQII